MIIVEKFINPMNNKTLKKTYSSENKRIKKRNTDEVYDVAIDKLDSDYIYDETDELIINQEEERGLEE